MRNLTRRKINTMLIGAPLAGALNLAQARSSMDVVVLALFKRGLPGLWRSSTIFANDRVAVGWTTAPVGR